MQFSSFNQILTLVAILMALCAAASNADNNRNNDFQQCFCWDNVTDTFCDADGNKTGDFWRSSCNKYTRDAFLWTIPAILLMLMFVFVPMIFCCGRYCCNCCGGRKESYGCCCPGLDHRNNQGGINDAAGTDPNATPTLRYPNKSIFFTKLSFVVLFAVWLYYCVGIYTTNNNVHWSVLHTLDGINDATMYVESTLNQTAVSAEQLSHSGFPFAAWGTLLDTLHNSTITFASRRGDIGTVLHQIRDIESNQKAGRNEFAYRMPSIGLLFFVLVFVLMLCSVKGHVHVVVSFLLSWLMVSICLLFVFHAVIAQAANDICQNYDSHFVPFLVDVVKSQNGCGNAGVVNDLEVLGQSFVDMVCSNHLADVLQSTLFQYSPSYQNSQNLCRSNVTLPPEGRNLLLTQLILRGGITTSSGASCMINGTLQEWCTLAQCAASCLSVEAQTLASDTVAQYQKYGLAMSFLMQSSYAEYAACRGLTMELLGNDIKNPLCNQMAPAFNSMSVIFLSLMIFGIAVCIVLVLAAKRFRPMKPHSSEEGVPQGGAHAFIYGVLVENQQEAAIVGVPLLGPAPQLPVGDSTEGGVNFGPVACHVAPLRQEEYGAVINNDSTSFSCELKSEQGYVKV